MLRGFSRLLVHAHRPALLGAAGLLSAACRPRLARADAMPAELALSVFDPCETRERELLPFFSRLSESFLDLLRLLYLLAKFSPLLPLSATLLSSRTDALF